MTYQIDELYQYLLNKKYFLIVFINYYHLIKMVISLFLQKQTLFFFNIKLDDLLIFVRLYNSRYESLLYIGHFRFSQQQSFRKLKITQIFYLKIFLFHRKMFK